MRTLLLIICVFVASCASPPQLTGPKFSALESPPAGASRLYLFRPNFTGKLAHESPWVEIGKAQIVQLAQDGFTSVPLAPGKHELAVRPAQGQSPLWNTTTELHAEAGKTYFAAVWMDQSGTASSGMIFVPLGGIVLPIPTGASRTIQSASTARIELVTEEQALPVLQEMRYLKPAAAAATH